MNKLHSFYTGEFLNTWISDSGDYMIDQFSMENSNYTGKYRVLPNKVELIGKHPYHSFEYNTYEEALTKLNEIDTDEK